MKTSGMHARTNRRAFGHGRVTIVSAVLAIAGIPVGVFGTVSASGVATYVNPVHVSFTLEGCRGDAGVFPAGGPFVCPDANYTSGNLGSGWNELDFVPHRLTTSSGSQADATTIYDVAVAADNFVQNDGIAGYDKIDAVGLNDGKSAASCDVTASGVMTTNSFGGTYQTIYRILHITQNKGTTCVIDWYEELAVGSHLNSGSSLHSNVALVSGSTITTNGIGAKDVSIPVKPIQPQTVTKTMSASQDSSVQWSIDKTASPDTLTFTNSCDQTTGALSKTSDITVAWTKQSVTPSGGIDTHTTITVSNPAHRPFGLAVTDEIFGGATPGTAGTGVAGPGYSGTIAAQTTTKVVDNVAQSVSAATLGNPSTISDRATGVFHDPVYDTDHTVTATASAAVQSGAVGNGAVDISDTELLEVPAEVDPDNPVNGFPSHVKFSASVLSGTGGYASGSFGGSYAGTATTGPVTWSVSNQTDSGSVTFRKTVTVDAASTVNAVLYDKATITPNGSSTVLTSDTATVTISAAPLVSLTVSKTIPVVLGSGDATEVFTFDVTGPASYSSNPTISFGTGDGGALHPKSATTLTGLQPGGYTIHEEDPSAYGYGQPGDDTKTITPDPSVGFSTCSATSTFTNNFGPASAQVKKVTDPASNEAGWDFTLTGPNIDPLDPEVVTTTDANFIGFTTTLDEGTYTVTETAKTNWDLVSVGSGKNNTNPTLDTTKSTCTFTVNYPADADAVFSCVFKNVKRGHVTVLKKENGGVPTHSYTFRLTGGDIPTGSPQDLTTDGTNQGSLDFGWHAPGTYTLCELAVPVGTHSTLLDSPYKDAPYNASQNSTTGDTCITLPLAAGGIAAITVDNTYPLGSARTIGYWRNWATCSKASVEKANKTGNKLLDDQLPATVATGTYAYDVITCAAGVSIVSSPSSKWAEHQLGAQLLAAVLNVHAGAAHSSTTDDKIAHAQALLGSVNWMGSPTTQLVGNKSPQRSDFLQTAAYLDGYNNNLWT